MNYREIHLDIDNLVSEVKRLIVKIEKLEKKEKLAEIKITPKDFYIWKDNHCLIKVIDNYKKDYEKRKKLSTPYQIVTALSNLFLEIHGILSNINVIDYNTSTIDQYDWCNSPVTTHFLTILRVLLNESEEELEESGLFLHDSDAFVFLTNLLRSYSSFRVALDCITNYEGWHYGK